MCVKGFEWQKGRYIVDNTSPSLLFGHKRVTGTELKPEFSLLDNKNISGNMSLCNHIHKEGQQREAVHLLLSLQF